MLKSFAFGAALLAAVTVQTARADDPAQADYNDAKELFTNHRGTPEKLVLSIQKLEDAEKKVVDATLKYDILALSSYAYYFQGISTDGDNEKKRLHGAGLEKGKAAVALNPELAEGYYYAGINLGRWAEANGILSSLDHKDELIKYAETAATKLTRQGTPGAAFEGYGPARTLGRVYFKLPKLFGGSRTKALKYQREAYAKGKEIAINVVYLAETLADKDEDKAEAIKLLDDLLAQSETEYNKDRIPENKIEFEEGRKLRADLN
jgi:hypothetical protein